MLSSPETVDSGSEVTSGTGVGEGDGVGETVGAGVGVVVGVAVGDDEGVASLLCCPLQTDGSLPG